MLNHEYTPKDIMTREKLVLSILGYQLNLKTPFTFLMFFFAKGFISDADLQGLDNQADISRYIQNIENLALFFIDMMVKHYEYYQFTSIAVAAAALTCARICVGIRAWSTDLERLTFVSWDAIQECLQMLFSSFESEYPEMYRSFIRDKPQIVQSYQKLLPKSTNTTAESFIDEKLDLLSYLEPSTYSHSMSSFTNYPKFINFIDNTAHQALIPNTEIELEPHRKLTSDTCDELLVSKNNDQQERNLNDRNFYTYRPSHNIQSKRGLKRSLSRDFGFRA